MSGRARNPAHQLSDLVCYFTNLADDLQKWLTHRSIDGEVLAQLREELREIANALDTGAPISPMPEIPLPPSHGAAVCRDSATEDPHLTMTRSRSDRRCSDAPLPADAGHFATMCSTMLPARTTTPRILS